MAERTFTTGQAALELGISSYKVRMLCEAGVISSELTATGRWRIPERELRHLQKHGIPEILREPADLSVDDDEEMPQSVNGTAPAPKSALYGPPSKQLIAAKENVLKLRNKAESKELERQIRQADRAEREEQQQHTQARRRQQWIERWLGYATSRVPKGSGLLAEIRSKVESALNAFRTEDPRTREAVDDIIEVVLRPIRRREDQERAVKEAIEHCYALQIRGGAQWCHRASTAAAEAIRHLSSDASYREMQSAARCAVAEVEREFKHSERLKRELHGLNLPWGATLEDREEARELASEAVARLAIGTSDSQISAAISRAIAPVRSKIEARKAQEERETQTRKAQEERERQIASHKSAINTIVTFAPLGLLGATDEERKTAQEQVRAALEQFPVGASGSQMEIAKEKALTPLKAKIREREEAERREKQTRSDAEFRARSQVNHIERRLNDEYEFDGGYSEMARERDRIRDRLVEELVEDPGMTDADIRSLIEDLAEE